MNEKETLKNESLQRVEEANTSVAAPSINPDNLRTIDEMDG